MAEEKFLLVSLDEKKSKKLAQVLANDTSRKILDFLSDKETATETDMSKFLKVPLSTVHYNVKALTDAGLLNNEEFNYSDKGKEVVHYSLANKYVIIAPKNVKGLREKLSKILPVIGAIFAGTYLVAFFGRSTFGRATAPLMAKSINMMAESDELMRAGSTMVAEAVPQTVQQTGTYIPEIAIWFFAGCVFSLTIFFIWKWAYDMLHK